MNIRTKLIAVNVIIIAVTLASITGLCLYTFKRSLEEKAVASQEARLKTFWELLYQKGMDVRIEGGRLMVGSYTVNGDNYLPDRLKELCGGVSSIFMEETRIATSVVKEDGSRALGTKLKGPAYEAVIVNGKPYRGEVEVLGVPYYAAYDPLKNSRGETVGAFAVAVKKSEYLDSYHRLLILIPSLALLFLATAAGITWFLIRRLFVPLNLMHDILVSSEATGDLTQRIGYADKNEVGDMCRAFNAFMEKFHNIVLRLVQTTTQVSSTSGMLSSAYEMMAGNAGDVANQAGTIAVASEQMAVTSNEVANNCTMAAQSSEQANVSALTGSAVVQQTVTVMNLIAERVRESAQTVEALGAKTEPPAVSQQRTEKADSNKKNGYDFTVSEKKSASAASLLLDTGSSAYDITASNSGNAPVSVGINIDKASAQIASADKTLPFFAVVPAHDAKKTINNLK
ncbi:methyl-accepting chemotaxis protein TlpC [Geobacter sp. OR-1]|uniref:methyl-accepting chemotaxis protein n=1 Tax=Geobacter sp. OR-1 TaxID=1266765 RepID=UPI000542804D|nr:methyl-accepting chemotaxis protein [Geobacter sp. OR-1]GAM11470.1 methyl-accepting chemotaxis protein TlpC [Geobacter sp. OR-1]